MQVNPLELSGCVEIIHTAHTDDRGSFLKIFGYPIGDYELESFPISQVNISRNSHSGTIRGMHMQGRPKSEYKMVSCLAGKIYDVLLDLRTGSKTFGRWCSIELTPLKNSVLVPPGVAHGFQCLEDNTTVHYLHSQPFAPELAEGLRFDDPELNISWPLPVTVISQADLKLPNFFEYRGRN